MTNYLILLSAVLLSTRSTAADFHLRVTYPDKEQKQFIVALDKSGQQGVILRSKKWSCMMTRIDVPGGLATEGENGKALNLGCSTDDFKSAMSIGAVCFEDKKTLKRAVPLKTVAIGVIEEPGKNKESVDKHSFSITCE